MDSNQQQVADTLSQTPQPGSPAAPPTAAPRTALQAGAATGPVAAAGAPPRAISMLRADVIIQTIGTSWWHYTALGLKCGAAYGAVCGLYGLMGGLFVLLSVPLGAVLGMVIGTVAGMILGVVNGLILGIISAACFYPLRTWNPYRRVIGLVSVLIALLPLLYVLLVLGPRFLFDPTGTIIFAHIPLVIASICSWFASRRVADKYAAQMQVAPGTLPYNLDHVDIYNVAFQRTLFSELQPSYRAVVDLTSIGMLNAWRRELLALMDLAPDARVCDLMSGQGPLWNHILPRLGPEGRLIAIDCAPAMLQMAQADLRRLADPRVELREGDALRTGLPDRSVSAVTCAFGPMLVNPTQINLLADEIARILDDHGVVGLVDLRLPGTRLLRQPYLLYLRRIVPLAGFAFGGDPYLYATLPRFVEKSSAIPQLEYLLTRRGFQLYRYHLGGGCASALVGMKVRPKA
jgi:ubiquinone/menaquinone biosynthesis C-methylase UbiE